MHCRHACVEGAAAGARERRERAGQRGARQAVPAVLPALGHGSMRGGVRHERLARAPARAQGAYPSLVPGVPFERLWLFSLQYLIVLLGVPLILFGWQGTLVPKALSPLLP